MAEDGDRPVSSLRARHTDETRSALVAAARRLFAEKGYYNVGIREFAAEAGVTRGALYHHFTGKEELLLAVLQDIHAERQAAAAKRHRSPTRPDRWVQLRQDLQIALDEMLSPDILQIMLVDAPSVLGWPRWRSAVRDTGLAAISKAVERSIAEGLIDPQPVEELAQLISASYSEATLIIAYSNEPKASRVAAGGALDALLAGLQRSWP